MCKENKDIEKILENYQCEGQYVFDFSDNEEIKIVEEKSEN